MCILAVAVERKLTVEEIRNCFEVNRDGAGVAWSKNGRNYLCKGFMDLDSFLGFYKLVEVLPHIVHFRTATSGGVRPELTHPFVVSLTSPLVLRWSGTQPLLAHNGVVTDWRQTFLRFAPDICRELRRRKQGRTLPPGPWSDTRAAAVIAALVGSPILSFLGGKWAFLDSGRVEIYGDFIQEQGVYFSNDGYLGVKRYSMQHDFETYRYRWKHLFDEEGDLYDAQQTEPDQVAPDQEDSREDLSMPRRDPRLH